nr:MAG TPA: hypothetical protein [Caudoviricetes sp.]
MADIKIKDATRERAFPLSFCQILCRMIYCSGDTFGKYPRRQSATNVLLTHAVY